MNDIERFENLQTTIKLNPKNFQARRELIMLCLDLGFEKVAMHQIKYLLEIFPDDANLYFNAGICWEKLKNFDNALLAYQKYGVFKATYLVVRRLLKCHPFHKGGYDPLP